MRMHTLDHLEKLIILIQFNIANPMQVMCLQGTFLTQCWVLQLTAYESR